jgi:hypothetical protein
VSYHWSYIEKWPTYSRNFGDLNFIIIVEIRCLFVVKEMYKPKYRFYLLLTVHHVMILGKWPTWRTILFCVFIFIFNSLHVSSTSCTSSGETNCVTTTSGNCRSPLVAVSCASCEWTPNLHTTRPPTQSDSYQRLYWQNLSLLMKSTMCSKHVES